MEHKIETMTLSECAEYLRAHGVRISKTTLSEGIAVGDFPFGETLPASGHGRRNIRIYKAQVDRWIKERSDG